MAEDTKRQPDVELDTDDAKETTIQLEEKKEEKDGDFLKINEEFAKKFTYTKKRQLLEKAKKQIRKGFHEHRRTI